MTCNQSDLTRLRFRPIMPKNFPGHWLQFQEHMSSVTQMCLTPTQQYSRHLYFFHLPLQSNFTSIATSKCHRITLFRPIVVFCGTECILQNILSFTLHIHEEYYVKYCQSHKLSLTFRLNDRVFHKYLLVPQNTTMGLNNVMLHSRWCLLFFDPQLSQAATLITESQFTPWTMKSDHERWYFSIVRLHAPTSMV